MTPADLERRLRLAELRIRRLTALIQAMKVLGLPVVDKEPAEDPD